MPSLGLILYMYFLGEIPRTSYIQSYTDVIKDHYRRAHRGLVCFSEHQYDSDESVTTLG